MTVVLIFIHKIHHNKLWVALAPMQRRVSLLIIIGLILAIVGATTIKTSDYFPLRTVKEIYVDEKSTDWYSTDYFLAQSGDKIVISVDVSGGSAKVRANKQNGEVVFGEVSGVILRYTIPVPSDDAYIVYIWTRATGFPSTYVNLTGTIALERVFLNFYVVGIGMIVLGSSFIIVGSVIYLFDRMKMEEKRNGEFVLTAVRKCTLKKRSVLTAVSTFPAL